ncbi:MAG: M23 family metallopeptidase [Caldilineaceae bacterium]
MLSNAPLPQPYRVVQRYGDNPAEHRKLLINGVPLLGHEGMDLAAPPGTQVNAVQEGAVLRVEENHPRYGRVVLLGHEWGQSLYAQLGQAAVSVGAAVKGGQALGTIGAGTQAGAPADPHLHFGLRIRPFAVDDGWVGHSDPAPYLDRLTQGRGTILGPHIIGGVTPHLDLLRRWQPRLITVLDPNPDEMALLRAACPQAVIVGRIFVPDSDVETRIRANPEAAAQWAHELTMRRTTPHVNYWQIANEVLASPADLPLLARFEIKRMQLAAAASFFCAIFAFSVGSPDLPAADRMGLWQLLYPAIEMAEQAGHIVAVHQYGAPDVWKPDRDWYGYRLEHQVLRRLPFKKVQFAVTEYGIDGLIQGGQPRGWQGFTDAAGYAGQLITSGRYLERFSGRVLGYSVFTLGHNNPWQTYEISGAVAEQVASGAPRGTWQQAEVLGTGIGPADDGMSTNLGEAAQGGGEIPPLPPTPPEPGQPDEPAVIPPIKPADPNTEPDTGQPTSPTTSSGGTETMERRVTQWADSMHLSIKSIAERPDTTTGDVEYIIKDVFTTRAGSWDVTSDPYSVPQWAKDAYLSGTFQKAFERTNLYAAVIGLDGQYVTGQEVVYWTGGLEKLTDMGSTTWNVLKTNETPGWATMVMFGSSNYDAAGGLTGPWCFAPNKPLPAEVLCGAGLPNGAQVSTFVVWQAVKRGVTPEPTPPTPTPPTPTPTPPTPTPPTPPTPTPPTPTPTPPAPTPGPTPSIQRRVGSWITTLNLKVKAIAERPDSVSAGDYVYLIKDIFTTRDGSWDPKNVYGGVDQWARDTYLKPFGDPEYFDDAGADHHLFAAILDKDGKLLKNMDMLYWSDGFAQLGNPAYSGYVQGSNGFRYPRTKERSGWANIVMDPGSNYVPERGEMGPWCWVPFGLPAEVMCGGGMPAKQHISVFVVWQAVAKGAVTLPGLPEGDHKIFLPGVMREAAAPQAAAMQAVSAPAPAAPPLPEIVRAAAWNRLGLEYAAGSPLAEYARSAGLGAPLSNLFEVAGHLAQAYHGGIVMAPVSEPGKVTHIVW